MTDETKPTRERVAELEAERDKVQRAAKTLGDIIEKQCRDILDITGLHDWIDKDGDGDWGAVWENAYALRPERDDLREQVAAAAEQRDEALTEASDLREQLAQAHQMLAAVEALADESRYHWNVVTEGEPDGYMTEAGECVDVDDLRAALANPGSVLAKRDAQVLREVAKKARRCWVADGGKNLKDPESPGEVAYSFDRWLEVMADRLEADGE